MNSRDFDPVQLGSIELFCKAAELSGFSAAAEAMGVTPAAVSRAISRLEKRLGVRLFARTTRQIKLTDDGRLYYANCTQALTQIREAERTLSGQKTSPSGVLRISAPTTYGHYRLMPLLPQFAALYPEVQLDLSLSNRNIDFVDEGFDLAIRLGTLEDSSLVARKLEDATLGIFAAPAYLAAKGTPQVVADLHHHTCIPFILPSTGRPFPWRLRQTDKDLTAQEIDFVFESKVNIRDDVLACVSFAQGGGGLCQTFHFVAMPAVLRGELVEVLPECAGATRPFSLLYPHNRHMSARVRVFVEYLVKKIQDRV
jgi:DNA-binding transcriptional LysR family regulator